ncbi:MAG: phosphoribosyltransferase family protein [Deinococcales bacterium]
MMADISSKVLAPKVALDFQDISRRLKSCPLPSQIDGVVGIATGGILPASLLAHQLDKPLELLYINYRHEDNRPRYDAPKLLRESPLSQAQGLKLLLVDDVSVTGQSLKLAKTLLKGHHVMTLVLKGRADYIIYPEVSSCVWWPWKLS